MPYNAEIEARIKKIISAWKNTEHKNMFGGVCHLLNGNMCFGILRKYLILRTSNEKAQEMLQKAGISSFDITGRLMKGWLMVSPDLVETDDELLDMLKIGTDFTSNLPAK